MSSAVKWQSTAVGVYRCMESRDYNARFLKFPFDIYKGSSLEEYITVYHFPVCLTVNVPEHILLSIRMVLAKSLTTRK